MAKRGARAVRPLSARQARDVIRAALTSPLGRVSYSTHAEERLRERGLETTDVVNVLRAGAVQEPEDEGGGRWRYRITTARLSVVVALAFQGRATVVRVITALRN